MAKFPDICVFIDENLEHNKVGLLSVVNPPSLQQVVMRLRERVKVYDEIKWTKISKLKLSLYEQLVDQFFWYKGVRLNVVDINSDLDKSIRYGLNRVDKFCNKINGIFIDWHTTPRGYDFEGRLSNMFDCGCVMRLDSKSTDLLQLADFFMNLSIKYQIDQYIQSEHKRKVFEKFKQLMEAQSSSKVFFG